MPLFEFHELTNLPRYITAFLIHEIDKELKNFKFHRTFFCQIFAGTADIDFWVTYFFTPLVSKQLIRCDAALIDRSSSEYVYHTLQRMTV